MERCRARRESGQFPSARALVCLALALALALLAPSLSAVAADAPRVVALGESNDAAERAELLTFFGATDATQVVPVTVDETLSAAGEGFDLAGVDTAYSSAALACSPAGTGVAVVTRNIEVVPPVLYALALVTAGITDVRLAVGAPDADAALGMTALVGVFKAWDAAPCGIGGHDADRRQLALDEVALVVRIGQAQGGPDGAQRVTGAMQDAQMRVVVDGADPEAALAAAADTAKLDLAAADLADGTAFLSRLATAGIDWAGFARGWTLAPGPKGVGVLISPNDGHPDTAAVPTGVGGLVSTVVPTSQTTATAMPTATATATPMPTATAMTTPMPTATAAPGTIAGTVQSADGSGHPLALAAALALALLMLLALVVLGVRRRRRPVLGERVSPAVAAAASARRRAAAGGASVAGAARRVAIVAPRRFSVPRRSAGRPRSGRWSAAEE